MSGFLAARFARALLTMWLVHAFTFFALRLNIDVADVAIPGASEEALAAFRQRWGLDRPMALQYAVSVLDALRGDLGLSFRDGRTAAQWVLERMPQTFLLSGVGFALMVAIGVPAGVYAATQKGRAGDSATLALAIAAHALPSFVLSLALIFVFAVMLHLLPSSGIGTWRHMVLPVGVYAASGAGPVARFTRAAMLDVLGQPYILAARAAGVAPLELTFRHALPNAAIALVTHLGLALGATVGGAIIVETVFAWPGMGLALSEAVGGRDLPIVQTMVLVFALFMVLANLLVDVAYGLLNPKIRIARHGD